MRPITIVLPHFCNLGMLAEQQAIWMAYPPDLRQWVHVVLVDDCSPEALRPTAQDLTATGLGSLRVYQLLEKKRWNWLACRNLGAREATTEWLLLTDIDHGVPERTMRRLIAGDLDPRNAYRFQRVTATRTWPYEVEDLPAYKAHNDSWALTRALFFDDRVGGYDERLSGCYGTSGEFRDRLLSVARQHVIVPEPLIRYPREIIPDASTSPDVYARKNDRDNDRDLRRRKAARDLIPGWKPLHGLIPYRQGA